MSLLFDNRGQGAEKNRRSVSQRLVMLIINNFAQMIGSLGHMWRTPSASFMTIAVLGLSLTLPATLHVLVKNVKEVSDNFDNASEISLFLKENLSQQSIDNLVARINLYPEVDSTEYISPQQGMQEFKSLSGFGSALNYLDENPLPPVIIVKPDVNHTSVEAAKRLLKRLQTEREVALGKLDIEWLQRLNALVRLMQESVYTLATLLLCAVVLIIGNTIRLAIMNEREQIEVMKLVGATESFIQRPFLYTGIWYGFFGGFMAFLVLELMLWWIGHAIQRVALTYHNDFALTGLTLAEFGILMGVSIGLGFGGSLVSVQRYVKEIEPEML